MSRSSPISPVSTPKSALEKPQGPFWKPWIPAIVDGLTLGLLALILGLLVYVVAGDKLAMALGSAVFAIVLSWKYPKSALWFFFLYMPFAGTVTYWIAGGNSLFQLAKDAFYIPALFAIYFQTQKSHNSQDSFLKPKVILPYLWILVAFCLLSIFFVSLPRQIIENNLVFLQSILGFKVFLGYIPLIFIMQIIIKDYRDVLALNRLHLGLAITCSFLCLIQYILLTTGRCQGTDHLQGSDLFQATLSAKCLVGGALVFSPSQDMIRLPGTFVAPWQWAWFLIANAYITFAVTFSDRNLVWRLLGFVGMGSVTMAAVICGQRIALALVPASFIILLVLTGQLLRVTRVILLLVGFGIVGLVAWSNYQDLILERIASFQSRWAASPADAMIGHQFEFVWKSLQINGAARLVGHGLGSATNSTRMFGDVLLIETWFPKVMYETGLVGLSIFLLFVTAITISTFWIYIRLKNSNLRDLAACLWVFILFISYQTYYYPLDVDPVAVYYWMFAGTIYRLPAIDRQLQEEAQPLEQALEPGKPPSQSDQESRKISRFVRIREGQTQAQSPQRSSRESRESRESR